MDSIDDADMPAATTPGIPREELQRRIRQCQEWNADHAHQVAAAGCSRDVAPLRGGGSQVCAARHDSGVAWAAATRRVASRNLAGVVRGEPPGCGGVVQR